MLSQKSRVYTRQHPGPAMSSRCFTVTPCQSLRPLPRNPSYFDILLPLRATQARWKWTRVPSDFWPGRHISQGASPDTRNLLRQSSSIGGSPASLSSLTTLSATFAIYRPTLYLPAHLIPGSTLSCWRTDYDRHSACLYRYLHQRNSSVNHGVFCISILPLYTRATGSGLPQCLMK